MKAKSKVIIAITMLFLVSTIAGATSVNAVKAGEAIKIHMRGEGEDIWDPSAMVLIKANIEHNYVSSWLDKGEFKKTAVDPVSGEEVMLSHGKIKKGEAFYLDWWQNPQGQWWQYVWIIVGMGVVKTQTTTYSEATITLIFCLSGNWVWAGFNDTDSGDLGPISPGGEWGTLTFLTEYDEFGMEQFDYIKLEHTMVLNAWSNRENIIRHGSVVNIAETNYIVLGMIQTDEERKDHLFNTPWTMSIVLDEIWGVELSSFWWYDKEGLILDEPGKILVFYHIYEPWSLGGGLHTLDHEFSWYNGVGKQVWQEFGEFRWEFTAWFW